MGLDKGNSIWMYLVAMTLGTYRETRFALVWGL